MMNYKNIEIVPYNPEWPHWFEMIKSNLNECIGNLILSIDHIGSTSVPGLGAKNRIDIQVTVEDITTESKASIDKALKKAGIEETEFSKDHSPLHDIRTEDHWKKLYLSIHTVTLNCSFHSNVHFRVKGKANHTYSLLFRDYLRCHSAAAAAYQDLKEKLAQYHTENIHAYCDIKDPACDIIMSAAQEWAERTYWSPQT